jgi:hypothetical protein
MSYLHYVCLFVYKGVQHIYTICYLFLQLYWLKTISEFYLKKKSFTTQKEYIYLISHYCLESGFIYFIDRGKCWLGVLSSTWFCFWPNLVLYILHGMGLCKMISFRFSTSFQYPTLVLLATSIKVVFWYFKIVSEVKKVSKCMLYLRCVQVQFSTFSN